MARELKMFELRGTNKPALSPLLSTTVAVYLYLTRQPTHGYCYVMFSAKMVEFVGKKMPQGLSPSRPAYLIAIHGHFSGFTLYAQYAHEPLKEPVMLWGSPTAPSWLKCHKPKVKSNVHDPASNPKPDTLARCEGGSAKKGPSHGDTDPVGGDADPGQAA